MEDSIGFIELLLKALNEPWIVVIAVAAHYFFLKKEIGHIKESLNNHITETNDKIDKLSDRLDRLYELLLKDRGKDSDKK